MPRGFAGKAASDSNGRDLGKIRCKQNPAGSPCQDLRKAMWQASFIIFNGFE